MHDIDALTATVEQEAKVMFLTELGAKKISQAMINAANEAIKEIPEDDCQPFDTFASAAIHLGSVAFTFHKLGKDAGLTLTEDDERAVADIVKLVRDTADLMEAMLRNK